MTKNYQISKGDLTPIAYVTKGRQRVKQYEKNVYLKNGDEFEIELFNPSQDKILGKISLNGKSLDSGIILRPGERVFLERFIDEAQKFLFETYIVDSKDPNVLNAIAQNGLVEVEFFKEKDYQHSTWGITMSSTSIPTSTYTIYPAYSAYPISQSYTTFIDTENFSCSCFNELETGRIEKGSKSNQSFVTSDSQFHSSYSWKSTWKILPESERPKFKEDLSVYCTNCGAKRKKTTFKYCPNCGQKF